MNEGIMHPAEASLRRLLELSERLQGCSAITVRGVSRKRDRSKEGLTAQALAILARLRDGPATSLDLQGSAHCVSHTARVSELRRRGYDIECRRERTPTGDRCTYTLKGEPA